MVHTVVRVIWSLQTGLFSSFFLFRPAQLASTSVSYMRVVHVLFLLLNINKVYLLFVFVCYYQ